MEDLERLIEQDLGQPVRRGSWLFWRCPFHEDQTPSLGVKDGRYYCFGCGKWGDAVDWLKEFRHLPASDRALRAAYTPRAHKPDAVLPDAAWQQEAMAEIERAQGVLLNMPEGQPVREYLARRGLTRRTWEAWQFGAAQVYHPEARQKRMALVIPWLDGQGITAVKYRFIDDGLGGLRYRMRKGSRAAMFCGLWRLSLPVVFVVEGELNAASIWQVVGDRATVISPGGQSVRHDALRAFLEQEKRYKIVWFDDYSTAFEFSDLADRALCSPFSKAGVKMDANQMLQDGILSGFLVLAMPAQDGHCVDCGAPLPEGRKLRCNACVAREYQKLGQPVPKEFLE
jgi:hypothetical protein